MKKKLVTLMIIFLTSTLCFSTSPNWLIKLEKVFPTEKYIRAIGEGSSISFAKQTALSELSSYFEQTIESQTYATKKITQNNLFAEETSNIQQNFISTTKSEFFQVEYTDFFYNKKTQKYFICAYINKENFWKVLSQKIKTTISNSNILIQKIKIQNEPLKKVFYYNQVKNFYDEFYKLYKIALCVYPKKCYTFLENLKKINEEIYSINNLINQISIKIDTTGDKEKFIETKIFKLLSKNGFLISSQNGMYKLNAEIIWNENEFNGVFSSFPKIIFLVYKNSELLKSFEICSEKFSTYNYQTLEKKEIFLLEKYLDEFFLTEFFE